MAPGKHITSACLSCRRRKVKCDGMESCSNCSTSSLECKYDAEGDMRKLSPKKIISSLEARLALLEKTLRDNNIDQPPASASSQSTAPSTVAREPGSGRRQKSWDKRTSLGNSYTAGPSPEASRADVSLTDATAEAALPQSLPGAVEGWVDSETLSQLDQMDFTSTRSIGPWPDSVNLSPPNPEQGNPHLRPTSSRKQSSNAQNESENDVTDILAARMGSLRIAEDGQLRYYGSTSNLHLHRYGYPSLSHASIRRVTTDGLDVLRRLDLDRPVPSSLETHLAKLYFAWEDPAIHCVDEQSFFEEKRKWNEEKDATPYYSETLNNAICAIGACLAGVGDAEPALLDSEFYSNRAKALLDIEMDSPTVATVQALVIMSATEAAFTRDARGWLYSGMAARLSADLGLHLDVSEQTRQGLLDARDIYIRQTAYQGVYIHESMWALYVGRPGGIGPPHIPRLDQREPINLERTWSPYGNNSGGLSEPTTARIQVPFDIEACTAANVTLGGFMRQINSTLYSATDTSDLLLLDFLRDTSQRLESWYYTLESSSLHLDVDDQSTIHPPAILQLHMQYESTVISLFRPYLSKSYIQDADSPGLHVHENYSGTIQEARKRCVSSALRISNILRRYKSQHSLSHINVQAVHLVFTAALVLIHDVCVRAHAEAKISLIELQFCCHALGEIGSCYGNATRALETIILVKGEWQRLAFAGYSKEGVGMKRSSVNISKSYQTTNEDHQRNFERSFAKRRNTNTTNSTEGWNVPVFSLPPSFNLYGPPFDVSQMATEGTLTAPSDELLSFDLMGGLAGLEPDRSDPNHSVWLDIQADPNENLGYAP